MQRPRVNKTIGSVKVVSLLFVMSHTKHTYDNFMFGTVFFFFFFVPIENEYDYNAAVLMLFTRLVHLSSRRRPESTLGTVIWKINVSISISTRNRLCCEGPINRFRFIPFGDYSHCAAFFSTRKSSLFCTLLITSIRYRLHLFVVVKAFFSLRLAISWIFDDFYQSGFYSFTFFDSENVVHRKFLLSK